MIDATYATSNAAKQVFRIAREQNGYEKNDKSGHRSRLLSHRFEKTAWPMYPPLGDKDRQIPIHVHFRASHPLVDMTGLVQRISGQNYGSLYLSGSMQKFIRVWPIQLTATLGQPHRLIVFHMNFGANEEQESANNALNILVFDSLKRDTYSALQQRIQMLGNDPLHFAVLDTFHYESQQTTLLRAKVQVDYDGDIAPWIKKYDIPYLNPGREARVNETELFQQLSEMTVKLINPL